MRVPDEDETWKNYEQNGFNWKNYLRWRFSVLFFFDDANEIISKYILWIMMMNYICTIFINETEKKNKTSMNKIK